MEILKKVKGNKTEMSTKRSFYYFMPEFEQNFTIRLSSTVIVPFVSVQKGHGNNGYKYISIFLIILFHIIFFSCQNNAHRVNENERRVLSNWRFQIDISDIGEKEHWYAQTVDKSDWKKVKAPAAWDTYDEALWGYEGIGWYAYKISKGSIPENKRIFIRFNRVNYYTKVWLNGEFIGENIDGYLPFELDVTDYIKQNIDNWLVLRVDNKPRINWLPASIRIEWVQYGGILQPVEMFIRNPIFIKTVAIKTIPKKESAEVDCRVNVANYFPFKKHMKISAQISAEFAGNKKSIDTLCSAKGGTTFLFQFTLPNAKLWSPHSPHLYQLIVTVSDSSKRYDRQINRFGIRSISTKKNQILLNGNPIKIKGFNRYDIFGRKGPVWDKDLIKKDLLKIKRTGANAIRVHYPQSPLTIKLMDEIGLMLIEELPLNWWGQNWWTKEKVIQDTSILKQAKWMLRKMILRDKNHPCIIAWSLANECKTETKIGTYVIDELIKEARELDDARLVSFTVNNETNLHPAFNNADIVCCNVYYGNDEAFHINMLDSLVRVPAEAFLRRQIGYYPDKPLLVTEFGACGIYGITGDVLFSENHQAAYIKKMWEAIRNVPQCSGGLLWCWADYYHHKNFIHTYAPFGPYGVLNVKRKEKKSYGVINKIFKQEQ